MSTRTQKIFNMLKSVQDTVDAVAESSNTVESGINRDFNDLEKNNNNESDEPQASTSGINLTINKAPNCCNQSVNNNNETGLYESDVSEPYYDSDQDPNFVVEGDGTNSASTNSVQNEEQEAVIAVAMPENEHVVEQVGKQENIKQKRNKRKLESAWKRNISKRQRSFGEQYQNASGVIRPKKMLKPPCPISCTLKCNTKMNEEGRSDIFKQFWVLGCINRKRDYICQFVKKFQASTSRTTNSRRKFTQTYSLAYQGQVYKVCKTFFLNTLSISEKMLRVALNKSLRSSVGMPSPDKRGVCDKRVPVNKTSDERHRIVEEHIHSFPRMPSHWCRKDTQKEYLEAVLNREKMYDLYITYCTEKNARPVSKTYYKEVLLKKNIAFFAPRKDQCWCHDYETRNNDEKLARKDEYLLHIRRKNAANESKETDTKLTIANNTVLTANFDLEAVLYSPLYHANPIFYKRKLATFNLTIFEVSKKQGHCFLWDEINGKRGANEIATCVNNFIMGIPSVVEHLILYSDSCPGQNKNAIVACMLQHSLTMHPTLKSIEMKFLEPGHTHMECDSMHATIEKASAFTKIYWPNDWLTVIGLAKRKGPQYKTTRLTFGDFKDYKDLKNRTMPNTHKAIDGSTLNWKEVKCLLFQKNTPNSLFFKLEYWNDYTELKTDVKRGRRFTSVPILKKAYKSQLPITGIKYSNLMDLCKDNTIPAEYHQFYVNLPHTSGNNKQQNQTNDKSDSSDDEISLHAMRMKMTKRKLFRN